MAKIYKEAGLRYVELDDFEVVAKNVSESELLRKHSHSIMDELAISKGKILTEMVCLDKVEESCEKQGKTLEYHNGYAPKLASEEQESTSSEPDDNKYELEKKVKEGYEPPIVPGEEDDTSYEGNNEGLLEEGEKQKYKPTGIKTIDKLLEDEQKVLEADEKKLRKEIRYLLKDHKSTFLNIGDPTEWSFGKKDNMAKEIKLIFPQYADEIDKAIETGTFSYKRLDEMGDEISKGTDCGVGEEAIQMIADILIQWGVTLSNMDDA